jgi:hypothetical protein
MLYYCKLVNVLINFHYISFKTSLLVNKILRAYLLTQLDDLEKEEKMLKKEDDDESDRKFIKCLWIFFTLFQFCFSEVMPKSVSKNTRKFYILMFRHVT